MAPDLLEQLEGAVPEVQTQDVALVGQQVVRDAQARHRREVAVDDARGDVLASRAVSLPPGLDGVQRLGLQRLALRVGGVEVADPGVEVPAVVVEAAGDRRHLGQRLAARGAGSRRRRRPPGRRCRRCSSGRRRRSRGGAAARTNVSPRHALRRWPMWAALFGLMLVCSTMTCPGRARRPGGPREEARAARGRRRRARGRG